MELLVKKNNTVRSQAVTTGWIYPPTPKYTALLKNLAIFARTR